MRKPIAKLTPLAGGAGDDDILGDADYSALAGGAGVVAMNRTMRLMSWNGARCVVFFGREKYEAANDGVFGARRAR